MNLWKLCGNCAFPQNFHIKKLGEITAFYAVLQVETMAIGKCKYQMYTWFLFYRQIKAAKATEEAVFFLLTILLEVRWSLYFYYWFLIQTAQYLFIWHIMAMSTSKFWITFFLILRRLDIFASFLLHFL